MNPARRKAALIVALAAGNGLAAACEVTASAIPDPAGAIGSSENYQWHGSSELAALIPAGGRWRGMGPDDNYRDKFWWWSEGFTRPYVRVEATRLDGHRESFEVTNATSGFGRGWGSMLVLMEFPSAGCWRVTGRYKDQLLEMTLSVGGD